MTRVKTLSLTSNFLKVQKYLQYLLDRWILHRILVKCILVIRDFIIVNNL